MKAKSEKISQYLNTISANVDIQKACEHQNLLVKLSELQQICIIIEISLYLMPLFDYDTMKIIKGLLVNSSKLINIHIFLEQEHNNDYFMVLFCLAFIYSIILAIILFVLIVILIKDNMRDIAYRMIEWILIYQEYHILVISLILHTISMNVLIYVLFGQKDLNIFWLLCSIWIQLLNYIYIIIGFHISNNHIHILIKKELYGWNTIHDKILVLTYKFTISVFIIIYNIRDLNQSQNNILTIIFFLVICLYIILRLRLLYKDQPYYSIKLLKLSQVSLGFQAGCCISILINQIIMYMHYSNHDVLAILCTFCFVVITMSISYVSLVIINNRLNKILIMNQKEIKQESMYLLKYLQISKLFRNGFGTTFQNKDVRLNELILQGLIKDHLMVCQNCPQKQKIIFYLNHHTTYHNNTFRINDIYDSIKTHILDNILNDGILKFPLSISLNSLYIIFMIKKQNQYHKASLYIDKIKYTHHDLDFSKKLMLEYINHQIMTYYYTFTNHSKINIQRFNQCEKFYQNFINELNLHAKYYHKFWSLLQEVPIHINKLLQVTDKIHRHENNEVKVLWDIYANEFSEYFYRPYQIYAKFLYLIKDRESEYITLERRYLMLIDHLKNFDAQELPQESNLFSNNTILILADGHKENIGNILSCSSNIVHHLGYQQYQLENINISQLTTNYISQYHNQFIMKYFETGNPRMVNQTAIRYCLHQKGYVIPFYIHLKVIPNHTNELRFLGILRPCQNFTNIDILLVRNDGIIDGMSQGIMTVLQVTPEVIGKLHINEICKDSHLFNDIDHDQDQHHDCNKYLKDSSNKDIDCEGIDDVPITIDGDSKKILELKKENRIISRFRFTRMIQTTNSMITQNKSSIKYGLQEELVYYMGTISKEVYSSNCLLKVAKLTYIETSFYTSLNDLRSNAKRLSLNPTISQKLINESERSSLKPILKNSILESTKNIKYPSSNGFFFQRKFSKKISVQKQINLCGVKYQQEGSLATIKTILESQNKEINTEKNLGSSTILKNKVETAESCEFQYQHERPENSINREQKSIIDNSSAKFRVTESQGKTLVFFQQGSRNDNIDIHKRFTLNCDITTINNKSDINRKSTDRLFKHYISQEVPNSIIAKNEEINFKHLNKLRHKKKFKLLHYERIDQALQNPISSLNLKIRATLFIIYLILNLIVQFIYINMDKEAINKINNDIWVMKISDDRLINFIEVNRRTILLYSLLSKFLSINRHKNIGINNYALFCAEEAYKAAEYMLSNNTYLMQVLPNLNDNFQNEYYDLRITLNEIANNGSYTDVYLTLGMFEAIQKIYQASQNVYLSRNELSTNNNSDIYYIIKHSPNEIILAIENLTEVLMNDLHYSIDNTIQYLKYGLIVFCIVGFIILIMITIKLIEIYRNNTRIISSILRKKFEICERGMDKSKELIRLIQQENIYNKNQFIFLENLHMFDQPRKQFNQIMQDNKTEKQTYYTPSAYQTSNNKFPQQINQIDPNINVKNPNAIITNNNPTFNIESLNNIAANLVVINPDACIIDNTNNMISIPGSPTLTASNSSTNPNSNKFNLNRNTKMNINENPKIYKTSLDFFGYKIRFYHYFCSLLFASLFIIVLFIVRMNILQTHREINDKLLTHLKYSKLFFNTQTYLMIGLYDYIANNGTTLLKNESINTQMNHDFQIISNLNGFISSFQNDNGELEGEFEFPLSGNICTIVPPSIITSCNGYGEQIGFYGIISLNSFMYRALYSIKNYFDTSDRTFQDQVDTFSLEIMITLEGVYARMLWPAYTYLFKTIYKSFNNANTLLLYKSTIFTIITSISTMVITVLLIILSFKSMLNEANRLKNLLHAIPKEFLIKDYLTRKYVSMILDYT